MTTALLTLLTPTKTYSEPYGHDDNPFEPNDVFDISELASISGEPTALRNITRYIETSHEGGDIQEMPTFLGVL